MMGFWGCGPFFKKTDAYLSPRELAAYRTLRNISKEP